MSLEVRMKKSSRIKIPNAVRDYIFAHFRPQFLRDSKAISLPAVWVIREIEAVQIQPGIAMLKCRCENIRRMMDV